MADQGAHQHHRTPVTSVAATVSYHRKITFYLRLTMFFPAVISIVAMSSAAGSKVPTTLPQIASYVTIIDSALTLPMAKKLASVYVRIDSLRKANPSKSEPQQSYAGASGGEMMAATPLARAGGGDVAKSLIKEIEGSREMMAAVGAAGFTPTSYANQYSRIQKAWDYIALRSALDDLASEGAHFDLGNVGRPSDADIAFVKANAEKLKKFGFKEPDRPEIKMGPLPPGAERAP